MDAITLLPSVPLDDYDTRFRGLVAPLTRKQEGFFQSAYTRDIIKSSILMILNTRIGERAFLPTFGSLLHTLLFQLDADHVVKLAEKYVTDSLATWEPRIRLRRVQTSIDGSVVTVNVTYVIISLSVEDAVNLTFTQTT